MKPDSSWIGEDITPKQRDMIRAIVHERTSLIDAAHCIDDKWDAWHFINANINVLGNNNKKTPVSKGQREQIDYINKYTGRRFHGGVYEEAEEFIKKHFNEANRIDREQRKQKSCKHCENAEAQFFDENKNYSTTEKSLCLDCYIKVGKSEERFAKYSVTEDTKLPVSYGAETKIPTTTQEENNMFKNLNKVFGEFGQDKSGRFALSFLGTAVKVNDTYVTFDGEETTDVMEMIVPGGESFLFKMPATIDQIDVGDVVLSGDRVLFVRDVKNNGNIEAIDPTTNDIVTHAPRKNVFGIQFYTRVTSLMNFGGEEGGFNPLMLMAFSGEGKNTNDMLPFLMMGQSGGEMQQFLPFLMMASGDNNGNNKMSEMLPMLMMSQAFTGNKGNAANPFAALFPKKEKPKAKPTDGENVPL